MKSKRLNKAWLHDHLTDPYVKMAQREGYRARAAYKLKEIDETHGLLRPGQVVVDLGAAPGAWSQYVRRKFAPAGAAVGELAGTIIALDVLEFESIEGVTYLRGDFREESTMQARSKGGCGVVGHGAQSVGHRIIGRCARGSPGGVGGGFLAQASEDGWPGCPGLQGLSWQWLQPTGQAVQGQFPGGQAHQAQGVSRPVV